MGDLKKCNRCEEFLKFSDFYKDSSKKDGLCTICKRCKDASQKRRYEINNNEIRECHKNYYIKNKDQIKRRQKEFAKLHPERVKENAKRNYEKHRNKRLTYIKNWQKSNPNKVHTYKSKWTAENQEKIKIKNKLYFSRPDVKENVNFNTHLKRARQANLESTLTRKEWKSAKLNFENSCAYCGAKVKLTKDHFIPVVKKRWIHKRQYNTCV